MNTHSLKMIVVFLSLAALVSSSQAGDKRYLGGSEARPAAARSYAPFRPATRLCRRPPVTGLPNKEYSRSYCSTVRI